MNKNRWLMLVTLGLLLSINHCVQAQVQHHAKRTIGSSPAPLTPALAAAMAQEGPLAHDAAADLYLRNYAQAEAEAREALSIEPSDGVPAEVLAAALDAQGKDQESLQAYQTVVDHYDRQPRNLLPYAQLLLKAGQWAQAVAVYNQALPRLGHEELEQITSHFSPDVPQPAALETAIHLERGRLYNAASDWAGEAQDTEAMAEYQKALQLAPDNALTNYYYGIGWHKLSPAERIKFGTAQQAKAALQKAVKIGNAEVKAAALKALKNAG